MLREEQCQILSGLICKTKDYNIGIFVITIKITYLYTFTGNLIVHW